MGKTKTGKAAGKGKPQAVRPPVGLVIQRVRVGELNPAAYNPRKALKPGDPEYRKLARSIELYGYVDPIIWNRRSGRLVGGHQRLAVLRHGWTGRPGLRDDDELDVSVVDLDETAERQLNIALNKIAGEWDDALLAELLGQLARAENADIEATGFDQQEIQDLLDAELLSRQPAAEVHSPATDALSAPAFAVMVTCRSQRDQNACIKLLQTKGYAARAAKGRMLV